jgi:hypothetical protein
LAADHRAAVTLGDLDSDQVGSTLGPFYGDLDGVGIIYECANDVAN